MTEANSGEATELKPKKCPVCGKDCVPRKGPFGRQFMGCPDFPKCPGKAASLSDSQRKRAGQKLRWCYDFINRMGGVKEAEIWLKIASEVIIATKGGPVEKK